GIPPNPIPLCAGDPQGLEQTCLGKFIEGASGRLADDGRYEPERAGVVEERLTGWGRRRETEDVTTRVPRPVHALLVVVALMVRRRLHPLQTHRHGERVRELDAVLLGGTQVRQLGEEA